MKQFALKTVFLVSLLAPLFFGLSALATKEQVPTLNASVFCSFTCNGKLYTSLEYSCIRCHWKTLEICDTAPENVTCS